MTSTSRPALMLAYITCASQAEATSIGTALVSEHLAACINILPGMQSLYWWEGALTCGEETVLIAKGTLACAERLTARVRALHSYRCPCVVILPIVDGNPAYLDWLAGSVSAPE
jgi:periplasmic divalent cation tolerance protein